MMMEDVFHGAIDLCGGGGVRDMWRHEVWMMLGSGTTSEELVVRLIGPSLY